MLPQVTVDCRSKKFRLLWTNRIRRTGGMSFPQNCDNPLGRVSCGIYNDELVTKYLVKGSIPILVTEY